jgi:alpha-amylase
MLTWAMPADVSLQMENIKGRLKNEGRYGEMHSFLRGGLWENFLVKYRESNLMHKKMLHISAQFNEPAPGAAYDHLLQAQCNCSYWHGLFGGLYLSHIRNAVHRNLIAAQSLLHRKEFPRGDFIMNVREDIDLDGYEEINMASHMLDCLIHPSYGGSVSMLNLRPARFNLADTLTRRPEAYHHLFEDIRQGLVPAVLARDLEDQDEVASPHDLIVLKEEGLEQYLLYDWYDRAVFQDHVLPTYVTVHDFRRPNYTEWGDFVNQPYTLISNSLKEGRADCHMERKGHIWAPGGPWELVVSKNFNLGADGQLLCRYHLSVDGNSAPTFVWASELNLTLLGEKDKDKYLEVKEKPVSLAEIYASGELLEKFSLVSRADKIKVNFRLNKPALLWCWPVETISQSESGLEKSYQGSSLVVLWNVPNGTLDEEFAISLDIES